MNGIEQKNINTVSESLTEEQRQHNGEKKKKAFQQIVLDTHPHAKTEFRHKTQTVLPCKNQLNVVHRTKSIKFLEDDIGENIDDLGAMTFWV